MNPSSRALLLGARFGGRPFRAPCRQVLLHRGPRPLQRAVRGRYGRPQERGRLRGRPAEHVPGDQRGPLPGRQELHRHEEHQLDRLALDDLGLGLLVLGGRDDLVEQPVRVGLQPGHLGERPDRRQAARPPPQRVEADVRRDPVEPRPEQGAAVEPLAAAPRPEHRLLDRVLGLVERGQHPVAVDVELAPVALGEGREGGVPTERGHGHAAASTGCFSCTSQVFPSGSWKVRKVA